jgi:uncharacterized paraquat-inducible protein A
MDCPYCKSLLTVPLDTRPGIARCERCQRHLLFRRDVFGIRFSKSEAQILVQLAMYLVLVAVLLFGLLYALLQHPGLLLSFPCLAMAQLLLFGYEGYLAIQTGISKHGSIVSFGRQAIFWGAIQLGIAIFGSCGIFYALFLV